MFSFKKHHKGFTLIEILVVVSIIGVLASIVAVNFNKTQARSRDTKRIADLHALQSALLLYKNDNHSLPPNYCGSAYCMIPPSSNCAYSAEWDSVHNTWVNHGNCNKDIFKELIQGNYIDQLPKDPRPEKYTYYYYHDMGGGQPALISILEVIDANTINDAFIRDPGTGSASDRASWGCKMNLVRTVDGVDTLERNNSYCIAIK